MENLEKTIIGKCPLCGGDVIKTSRGYACANSFAEQAKCNFFMFSTIGNRRISDSETAELLKKKKLLLDGFSNKEGKVFASIIFFNQDGTIGMSSQIGVCPKCGGTLYVGGKAVTCGNFRREGNPCNFTLWRSSCGHDFSLEEIQEIIGLGATNNHLDAYDNQGNHSQARFGLNENKEVIKL